MDFECSPHRKPCFYIYWRKIVLLTITFLFLIACQKEEFSISDDSFSGVASTFEPDVHLLFENLNLEYAGLEEVKAAYSAKQEGVAIEALFEY